MQNEEMARQQEAKELRDRIQSKLDQIPLIRSAFVVACLVLVCNVSVYIAFSPFGLFEHQTDTLGEQTGFGSETGSVDFTSPLIGLIALMGVAVLEEFVFRALPLVVAVELVRRKKLSLDVIPFVLVVSSGLFGYLHGNFMNVLIQGVSGFLFGCFFLLLTGFRCRYLRAYAGAILAHFFFNTLLYLIRIL